jgi:hypothetical protein
VVSVQVVRMVHRAVLLMIRRSWVRAPPAPPATCGRDLPADAYLFPNDQMRLYCRIRIGPLRIGDERGNNAARPSAYLMTWMSQRVPGAAVMRSSPVTRTAPVISARAT